MNKQILNDALFPVKEVPAQLGADIITNTGHKFIIREDNGQVISCMTNEYKLLDNKTVYDTAAPIMKEIGATLVDVETFSEGAKTQFKWRLNDTKIDLGNGDLVCPEITVKNSYNGQWGLHILAGAFRLVCSNGMVIGIVIARRNYKHSIYNMELDDIEKNINDTIVTTDKIFKKELPQLKNTKVDEKHLVEIIQMIPSTHMEQYTQYLLANKPETYWDLLNSATWITTHSMKRTNEATHKLEQQIYPSITKWAKVTSVAKA